MMKNQKLYHSQSLGPGLSSNINNNLNVSSDFNTRELRNSPDKSSKRELTSYGEDEIDMHIGNRDLHKSKIVPYNQNVLKNTKKSLCVNSLNYSSLPKLNYMAKSDQKKHGSEYYVDFDQNARQNIMNVFNNKL